jgi:catechol 2,3-dioxygenase-like lactoylglutathione lyase family enzyme
MNLDTVEVITLFVDDVAATKAFYRRVFTVDTIFEDEDGAVLAFSGVVVNLLAVGQAPMLVEPLAVAPSSGGSRVLLTIRVDNADEVCAELAAKGVKLLNGPIDRPWGRRTAAFADPSGYVWEIAQVLS